MKWTSDNEKDFKSDLIFDHWKFKKEEEYFKVIRPSERHDLLGDYDNFSFNKEFSLGIIFKYKDEETLKKQIELVPHYETFAKFMVINRPVKSVLDILYDKK